METLKFKVGDKVRVKSMEWYNKNKDTNGDIISVWSFVFLKEMEEYCGKVFEILDVFDDDYYIVTKNNYIWQDWMLEDEPVDEEKEIAENKIKEEQTKIVKCMETKQMTLREAQEIVRNTKHIVWTEDESKALQEKLFEIGCQWVIGQEVRNTEHPFLYVNDNLIITFGRRKHFNDFVKKGERYKKIDDILDIEIEKPKFDPKTLQPFDKVLVRHNKISVWVARTFEFCSDGYYHVMSGSAWKCCIPFNNETKHLHRTSEEAPEYYNIWK